VLATRQAARCGDAGEHLDIMRTTCRAKLAPPPARRVTWCNGVLGEGFVILRVKRI
jgi:hypothetical protein